MCRDSKLVLLLSTERYIRTLLRELLCNYKDSKIITPQLFEQKDINCLKLVIIDESKISEGIPAFKSYSNVSVVVISKNCLYDKSRCFTNSFFFDYYIQHPVSKITLDMILRRTIGRVEFRDDENIQSGAITLFTQKCCIVCKDVKIFLTPVETRVIYTLIQNKEVYREEYTNAISNMSSKYLQVTVFRINIKFEKCLGLKPIKSRYRIGYYLSI